MIEIFKDIPQSIREQTKVITDLVLESPTLEKIQILADYAANSPTEEIKNFIDFYINLRFEESMKERNEDE